MNTIGIKAWLAGLFLISIVGITGYELTKERLKSLSIKSASFPIKYVRTEGEFQYLSKDEVKGILQPLVMASFFDADMQAIHTAVSTLPWVDAVTVKRVWPDAIDIKVHEKQPFARWGKEALITESGVIFSPKTNVPIQNLIIMTGPELEQVKVLEIMKGIKTALADQSMELAEFHVSDRWAWKIKLVTGMEILLGQDEQLKKLKRFLKTLTVLSQGQVDAMAVVDLRYPNGYAVSWRPGTIEIDWKAYANPDNEQQARDKALLSR
ncbi:MAG: cell division protein FtsQ/DivIB [Methylococcales bacterium]